MADIEGFQVVRKRKGHRNRKCIENHSLSTVTVKSSQSSKTAECDPNQLKKNIDKCRTEISTSEFFSRFQGLFVNGQLLEHSISTVETDSKKRTAVFVDPIVDIVCYGIGRIASCPIARYQFAFLLLLKEFLQIAGDCFIYEPLFSQDETMVVKEMGCLLIESNEEGKRKVEQITLFFMLHCGKPLYNSVLWANWGPGLSNVIILGNRFSSYQERLPSRQLIDEAPYIYNILPYTAETLVHNSFHHNDIFNDSAIHWFPRDMLTRVPHSVWQNCEEPKYDSNDPEIITQSLLR
ncbi:SRR1-like protein [Montipora foliosa]|uniref:SRR1-like protein n=1 Tax=Montipora foliosa TaxID=591990 RepID=UPI0035F108B8